MRYLCLALVILAIPLLTGATPTESLSKAKAEITAHKLYSADPLLQAVVNAPDAQQVQVEEALVLQTMIYCGDVFGAGLVMPPLAGAGTEGSPLKALVGQQLLMARRAFTVAAGSYLNTTVAGVKLEKVQVELPDFSDKDVEMITAALSDKTTLGKILSEYSSNPAAGQGLIAKANHLGLYTAFAGLLPYKGQRGMGDVRSAFKSGAAFDKLRYLNWLSQTATDFRRIVNEPKGPDLAGLSKRCDERILKLAGKDTENTYVKNAKARLGR